MSWYVWIIIAIVFLIYEVQTPGFFLACFSIGAIVVVVFSFFFSSLIIQIFIFTIVTSLSFLFLRPILNKYLSKDKIKTNWNALAGKSVMVEESIKTGEKGRVKVDGESWLATSDEEMNPGDKAVIEKVEGLTLRVKKEK